jgi:GR25 family glycosyltransferase involved in LPS biosynthesis
MKIFVLTLPAAKKRQEYMAALLGSLNLPFEFFFGVDGRQLNPEEKTNYYDEKKARRYIGRALSPGEIGCALGHRLIYKKMIDENIDRAIVLEDDITINDKLPVVIELLNGIKSRNYIIKLDTKNKQVVPWHQIRLNETYAVQQSLSCVWVAWGYYIDRFAAQTMYNKTKKIFCMADYWGYFKNYVKLRIMNEEIIWFHESIESIIGNRETKVDGGGERRDPEPLRKTKKFFRMIHTIFH